MRLIHILTVVAAKPTHDTLVTMVECVSNDLQAVKDAMDRMAAHYDKEPGAVRVVAKESHVLWKIGVCKVAVEIHSVNADGPAPLTMKESTCH